MTADIVLSALLVIAISLILIVTTLGCVLLARFVGPSLSRRYRTVIAAFGGSFLMLLPLLAVGLLDDAGRDTVAVFAAMVVVYIGCLIIAWLPARFATIRLDRLTEFDVEIFS